MFELNGKVALVTGGSRGIGRAIALALAERGARVAVNYVTNAEAAAEVVQAIGGGEAVALQGDVAKAEVRWRGVPGRTTDMLASDATKG